MKQEYKFFMKADLSKYLGEWVAIKDDKVIAHDKKFKIVFKKAKKKAPDKTPFITKVPNKEVMLF